MKNQIKPNEETLRIHIKRDRELELALNNVKSTMVPESQVGLFNRSFAFRTSAKMEEFLDTLRGDIRDSRILLGENHTMDVEYTQRDLVSAIVKSRELLEVYYYNAMSNKGIIQASELNGMLGKYLTKIAYGYKPHTVDTMDRD